LKYQIIIVEQTTIEISMALIKIFIGFFGVVAGASKPFSAIYSPENLSA
jgi:hypothetical protein